MVSQVSNRNNHLAIGRTIDTGSSYGSAHNLRSVPKRATFDSGTHDVTKAGRASDHVPRDRQLVDKRYWVANISGAARIALLSMTIDL